MKLIEKYQQGNKIPYREGYETKLASDIQPKKPTVIQDPEYGEIPFNVYQALFPNDYFYTKVEENDPEQLILIPASANHRMRNYRVPYYDSFQYAKGYNFSDAVNRNNVLNGSLYRKNPDPIDNVLNNVLAGTIGLSRYGISEAGKQIGNAALKGVNKLGKVLTPSTWVTGMFGDGYYSTLAGLGLDAATFGSMAFGAVKDMIDNGVNVENILGAAMSIPAVSSAYNAYKTTKTGKNLYNLVNAMNKALEDKDMSIYLYNRASNKDFLPVVHEAGIKPEFNATTTVNTKEGKIVYDPEHISRHFETMPTQDEIVQWIENSINPGTARGFRIRDVIRPTTTVTETDKKYVPSVVDSPPLFPHVNYSTNYGLTFKDPSKFGYRDWEDSYNTIFIDGEKYQVPNPLTRVAPISKLKPKSNVQITLAFDRGKDGDLVLKTIYPEDPLRKHHQLTSIPRQKQLSQVEKEEAYDKARRFYQNNSQTVTSPIFLNYEEYASRFPNFVWTPDKVTLKNPIGHRKQWDVAVDKVLADRMSAAFDRHLTKEIGVPQDNPLVRRTLIRRYTGTIPYGIPTPKGEFPRSYAGGFTFDGFSGPDIFAKMQKAGKISPKVTEEEFFNSLSPDEQTLYKYAKAGRQKVLGVELAEGHWGSKFNTGIEEAWHLQDIGNIPGWMTRIDAHNAKYLPYLQSWSLQLAGKEALPRLREAQRAYRMVEKFLPEFYKTDKFDVSLPNRFYRDLLRGSSRLHKFFPELREFHPDENRLIWELRHGYKQNSGLYNALEHIVYNEDKNPDEADSTIA